MILGWIILAFLCVYLMFRQSFLFSPTAIFVGYFGLCCPIGYLISYFFKMPSFFFSDPSAIPPASDAYALFLCYLCLFSFCVGRYLKLIPCLRLDFREHQIRSLRLLPLLLVSVIVAVAGALWLNAELGGLGKIFSANSALRSGGLRGLGIGTYAITVLCPTVFQFWLIAALQKKSRWVAYILVACVLSALAGGAFGFRATSAPLEIQTLVIVFAYTGRPSKKSTVFVAFAAVVLAAVSGLLRIGTLGTLPAAQWTLAAELASNSTITRVRGVEYLVLLTNYVDSHGYHYFGKNITETLLSVVPSVIYPKGISLTEVIGSAVYGPDLYRVGIYHDIYGGISYGIVGEGYWNLGIAGVILISFALGYVLRVAERLLLPGRVSVAGIIIVKAFSAFMINIVEAPQLGVNAICLNLFLNFPVLLFLTMPMIGHRNVGAAPEANIALPPISPT